MASTYSSTLRLQLMQSGEKTGVWGTITNTNLGQLIEQAITNISFVTVTDGADTVLTALDGVVDQSRSMTLQFQGALTASRNVICPQVAKVYVVVNNTTGGQAVTLKTAAVGSVGVEVPPGQTCFVVCNGTNVFAAVSFLPNLNYTAISYSTIDGSPIGQTTPSTGRFSTLVATSANINSGTIQGTIITGNLIATGGTIDNTPIGQTTPAAVKSNDLQSTGGAINGTTVGATTQSTGAFTSLSYSNQLTSTLADGTAPMVITSTTRVNNLNVNRAGFADTVTVVDDTSTAASFYPLFVSGTSGNRAAYLASSKWSFNPNTGTMTITAANIGTLTLTNPLGTAYGGTGNNKGMLDPRVTSLASGATITPNADTTDMFVFVTVSSGTVTLANPTGTPVNGQKLVVRITSTNTQTLSYGTSYRGSTDLGLPSALTGSSKVDYLGFFYNSASSKWDLVAKVFGF